MAKVKQHLYLGPEAMALRARDGTPPWGVHPCEVDAFAGWVADNSIFGQSLAEARRLRAEIEKQ